MKLKNIKKGRVIEHKESGAIAIVLNATDDGAELLFQNPDLNPHDTGYATYLLAPYEAEYYRLIKRPVVGVVYSTGGGFAAGCSEVFTEDTTCFSEPDGDINDYSPDSTLAVGFI